MKKFFLFLVLLLVPLAVFAQPADTVKKAIDNIIVAQDRDTGAWSRLSGEFPAEAEPTAWAVKVLSLANAAPDRMQKGVSFLLKDQLPDGSWNHNTAHTAFAIMALKGVRKTDEIDERVKKAMAYLKNVQDEQGGFRRIGKEGPTLTIYTAVVLCAALEAGCGGSDVMARKAAEWLKTCQNQDGGYGMPKNSPSLAASTAWSIRALAAYGLPPSGPSIKRAVTWLLATRKPTGGFSMVPQVPADPEVTAYAIMGLNAQPGMGDTLAQAADYLSKSQHPDGSYTSNLPVQFNREAKKNTQTTLFVAWALSELK